MEKVRRGIQSIEVGSGILRAMARFGRPVALKELVAACNMPAGKLHPYLVSFTKEGFVSQDPVSGFYELGSLALELGLAKLHRLDPVHEASAVLNELAIQTGQGVALAVWGNLGPTLVKLEEPVRPLHVNLRIGTVMSLVRTATGRLFAAYLPPKVVSRVLDADPMGVHFGSQLHTRLSDAEYQAQLIEVRSRGLSRALSSPIPGIDAFCAPVFDSMGHLTAGILVMGPSCIFDSSWDGPIASELIACAKTVSAKLGFVES